MTDTELKIMLSPERYALLSAMAEKNNRTIAEEGAHAITEYLVARMNPSGSDVDPVIGKIVVQLLEERDRIASMESAA